MASIKLGPFNGIVPKLTPRELGDQYAQTAENLWLTESDMQPLKEPLLESPLPDANRKTIYKWRKIPNGWKSLRPLYTTEWLSWTTDVDVVGGLIADDEYSTIYYTDGTTLHSKRYKQGEGVIDVSDISAAIPSSPTLYQNEDMVDPHNISATDCSRTIYYRGHRWEENLLKMKFYSPSIANPAEKSNLSIIQFDWRLGGDSIKFPSDGTSMDKLYSEKHDLIETVVGIGGGVYNRGTIQLTQREVVTNYFDDPTNNSGYTVPCDIEFTFKVDFKRNNVTQYVYYACTTVDSFGQESPPSLVSKQIVWEPNGRIKLSLPSGTKRLYRSAVGKDSSDFFFVAETTSTIYTDYINDSELGEVMPRMENPPSNMSGLVLMAGGFLVAFYKNELFFSEPYIPYSWPTKYRITLDYDVVGLAAKGNTLYVLTTGYPYTADGSHPEMITPAIIDLEQSCASKKSIAYLENGVMYASPDGVVLLSGGTGALATTKLYTREQWQALNPYDMVAGAHDGRYICFHDTGGIIFQPKGDIPVLSTTTETAAGTYSDIETDQLYLIQSSSVTAWMASTTNLLGKWRSKEYQSVTNPLWSSAKVIADGYVGSGAQDMRFIVYSDDSEAANYQVSSNRGFRIERLPRSSSWSFEVQIYDKVYYINAATSMVQLR